MQMCGHIADQHVSTDRTVFVTKSHWPVEVFFPTNHDVDRMFVITRNPIDVIPSVLYLTQCNS